MFSFVSFFVLLPLTMSYRSRDERCTPSTWSASRRVASRSELRREHSRDSQALNNTKTKSETDRVVQFWVSISLRSVYLSVSAYYTFSCYTYRYWRAVPADREAFSQGRTVRMAKEPKCPKTQSQSATQRLVWCQVPLPQHQHVLFCQDGECTAHERRVIRPERRESANRTNWKEKEEKHWSYGGVWFRIATFDLFVSVMKIIR